MPYQLVHKRSALDYLESLPDKPRRQLARRIDALKDNPKPRGCKRVQGVGHEGRSIYRIRSGRYRVLYFVDEQTVNILNIDDRKDVYKNL